jgi:hypothetical protein
MIRTALPLAAPAETRTLPCALITGTWLVSVQPKGSLYKGVSKIKILQSSRNLVGSPLWYKPRAAVRLKSSASALCSTQESGLNRRLTFN